MVSRRRISDEGVERLRTSYEAVTTLPDFEYSNTLEGLADFADKILTQQNKNGGAILVSDYPELANFMTRLDIERAAFAGNMLANTPLQKQRISRAFIEAIRDKLDLTNPAVVSPRADRSFVALLDARSPTGGPRQGSDDPKHPEKSMNTFVTPLSVLERPFDLCDRLIHARDKPAGNKHKYFASISSYGMRFDSEADANNAKNIFDSLFGKDAEIIIDEETIRHRNYYWLKVPSVSAGRILDEARSLSVMLADVATTFSAGDLDKAEQERTDLLELIKGMGLGSSHLAEQMAREVLQPKERVR